MFFSFNFSFNVLWWHCIIGFLRRGWWFPLSSLGILRVPQEHPLPLNIPGPLRILQLYPGPGYKNRHPPRPASRTRTVTTLKTILMRTERCPMSPGRWASMDSVGWMLQVFSKNLPTKQPGGMYRDFSPFLQTYCPNEDIFGIKSCRNSIICPTPTSVKSDGWSRWSFGPKGLKTQGAKCSFSQGEVVVGRWPLQISCKICKDSAKVCKRTSPGPGARVGSDCWDSTFETWLQGDEDGKNHLGINRINEAGGTSWGPGSFNSTKKNHLNKPDFNKR